MTKRIDTRIALDNAIAAVDAAVDAVVQSQSIGRHTAQHRVIKELRTQRDALVKLRQRIATTTIRAQTVTHENEWAEYIATTREDVAMFDRALKEEPSDPNDIRDLRDAYAAQIARIDAGEDPAEVFAFPRWTLEEARA